jgi:lipid-binding SYLF domain-containing protein
MQKIAFAAVAALAISVCVGAAISPGETARLQAAARVVQDIQPTIPQDYWSRARCIAVIPDLKKAAFIIGGEYGKGVMSCRSGDRWSAPVFMQLAKGSWGFQAGAEQVDLVLIVMNEQGVQKLLQNKVTLGADASIAAGPIGRQGAVGTDAQLTAEILSYSRAQGLFAGIDLSGGVLRPDVDANTSVYGSNASARTILASREISAPTEAQAFLAALGTATSATGATSSRATASSGQASSSPPAPRTTTVGTTDDDLRARVVDMQQTIDRMLADQTPVGTTGTAAPASGSGTVAVDRARLLQLRQQLDALLAALNRR